MQNSKRNAFGAAFRASLPSESVLYAAGLAERFIDFAVANLIRHPLRHRGDLNQFAPHGPIVRPLGFDVRPNFVQLFKDYRVAFMGGFQGWVF